MFNCKHWPLLGYLRSLKFIQLPPINGKYYVYRKDDWKTDFHFEINISEEKKETDVSLYGWVIEVRSTKKNSTNIWENHWNHKIYTTKEFALHAINQSNLFGLGFEARVVAMYDFRNNGFRNYIINKLLEENI